MSRRGPCIDRSYYSIRDEKSIFNYPCRTIAYPSRYIGHPFDGSVDLLGASIYPRCPAFYASGTSVNNLDRSDYRRGRPVILLDGSVDLVGCIDLSLRTIVPSQRYISLSFR